MDIPESGSPMTTQDRTATTRLLLRVSAGDRGAVDALTPLLYEQLRHVAHQRLKGERSNHTLTTTALVHEAYLRLIEVERVEWKDRAHFLAMASRLMRRVLVDYARRRKAVKRGGEWVQVDLYDAMAISDDTLSTIQDVDAALSRLEELNERQSRIVEQHYFAGLTLEECARVLGVSLTTVKREFRFAKAWLARDLKPESLTG